MVTLDTQRLRLADFWPPSWYLRAFLLVVVAEAIGDIGIGRLLRQRGVQNPYLITDITYLCRVVPFRQFRVLLWSPQKRYPR